MKNFLRSSSLLFICVFIVAPTWALTGLQKCHNAIAADQAACSRAWNLCLDSYPASIEIDHCGTFEETCGWTGSSTCKRLPGLYCASYYVENIPVSGPGPGLISYDTDGCVEPDLDIPPPADPLDNDPKDDVTPPACSAE